ncbi:MAG: hypothetical protein U0800_19015 [Isosphaeraceae bacterium]
MKKFALVTMIALVASTGRHVQAQDQGKGNSQKGQPGTDQGLGHQGQKRTIHGTVAGVTVLGETVFDYQSERAINAQASYLTIVETPSDEGKSNDSKSNDSKSGQSGKSGEQGQASKSGDGSKSRARIFLVSVGPKTEVCECEEGKGEKDKKKCDMARLELGDQVEVEMTAQNMGSQGGGQDAQRAGEGRQQPGSTKHGRQRIIRGEANSITILHHPESGSGSGQGSQSPSKSANGQR